ncbi:MAG TPA: glyoxalase/bleomycin resistance/extradiol dioxygenase family protein [Chitinophagaceae bacterium]|nr:glyoxalase/bleomycin resistance/extradiol dioxygenase family protein [Chitinophagaceae bacterium]
MRLSPYIFFPGTAEEALHFYSDIFGGTISDINRYEGSPLENITDDKQKIMHASVSFGNSLIMVCDATHDKMPPQGSNIQLFLEFTNVKEMNERFIKIAEGGKVTMELQDMFWGARFGMLTDKFGVNWMFNCEKKAESSPNDQVNKH